MLRDTVNMTRGVWTFVVLAGVMALVLQPPTVSALSCLACDMNMTCPCLPDHCEKGLRPCGCCYECKGKVGSKCSGLLVPCESDLMCVNAKGVALPNMHWSDFSFKGTCQKVASCQVIKDYDPFVESHESLPM